MDHFRFTEKNKEYFVAIPVLHLNRNTTIYKLGKMKIGERVFNIHNTDGYWEIELDGVKANYSREEMETYLYCNWKQFAKQWIKFYNDRIEYDLKKEYDEKIAILSKANETLK